VPPTPPTFVCADLYQRIQALLEEDDVRLMEPLLAELSPADWGDAANYDNRP